MINVKIQVDRHASKLFKKMNRIQFLKSMALLPLISSSMNFKDLNKITSILSDTRKMPVLFLGHGSPMNAIEEN